VVEGSSRLDSIHFEEMFFRHTGKLLLSCELTFPHLNDGAHTSLGRNRYEYLFVLNNLEKAGLLRRRETIWMDSASPFNTLRKSMILINAEVDTVNPDDVSYVSSGYAPLTVRLVQMAIQGWAGKEETIRELPGRLIDIGQQYPPDDLESALKRPRPSQSLGGIVKE
jgi:hypothetical protein